MWAEISYVSAKTSHMSADFFLRVSKKNISEQKSHMPAELVYVLAKQIELYSHMRATFFKNVNKT